jgi:hypothetical protein
MVMPDVPVDAPADPIDPVLRYATAIDRRDWVLFRTCFTDDCFADYGRVGAWQGVEPFARFMETIHNRCGRSIHRISNLVVTHSGDDRHIRSYVDALVLGLDNASGTRSIGWYDDEVIRTTHGWRISKRDFTMVYATSDIGRPLDA